MDLNEQSICAKPAKVRVLEVREKWANKAEFQLAVIGFSVDLGSVWRVPYICYRNGGGAFLIPYFVLFALGGLPLFYIELALGQYQCAGCLAIWKNVCPMLKKLDSQFVLFPRTFFYFYTVISWVVYFLFRPFTFDHPWKTCGHEWNTLNCMSILSPDERELLDFTASNESTSAASEFFMREVLEIHRSKGLHDLGGVKWSLVLGLLLVYFFVYFALWKGPRSSGKAVWITATVPYVVLIVLLVRGLTLPGAHLGIYYYLTPVWEKLYDKNVWIDAATQIFFSLCPGFGVLLALSTYNEFNNKCYK